MRASWRGALGRLPAAQGRLTTTTPRRCAGSTNCSLRGPFLGSRRMTAMLRGEGVFVNRKRVQRLMRLDGDRGARAAAENEQARARPQDLSPSPAQPRRSSARTTSGPPTSPIFRSGAAFSISWRSSTGHRARCLGGGCRTRWTFRSVWRRSRRRAGGVRQAGDFHHRKKREAKRGEGEGGGERQRVFLACDGGWVRLCRMLVTDG